jgi:hypothetical protein
MWGIASRDVLGVSAQKLWIFSNNPFLSLPCTHSVLRAVMLGELQLHIIFWLLTGLR